MTKKLIGATLIAIPCVVFITAMANDIGWTATIVSLVIVVAATAMIIGGTWILTE